MKIKHGVVSFNKKSRKIKVDWKKFGLTWSMSYNDAEDLHYDLEHVLMSVDDKDKEEANKKSKGKKN